MIDYKIKIPIYDHTVFIHVGKDFNLNDYEYLLSKEALESTVNDYDGAIFECQHKSESLLYLEKFDINSPKDISILAHECLHLTFYILSNVGINFNWNSEESFTYLHGYLVKEIITVIK